MSRKEITVIRVGRKEQVFVVSNDDEGWKTPIIRFLEGERQGKMREIEVLERRVRFYYLLNAVLFCKMFFPIDAKCLSQVEGLVLLREAYEGGCAENAGARSLGRKVIRVGFYWPTMKKDAEEIVKKCDTCQRHSWQIHTPAAEMIAISSLCPFARWGIDIVGPFIKTKGSNQFLVVVVDYFTKWVDAEPLSKITECEMIHFIWKSICCRFGLPRVLVSDKGP